MFQLQAFRARVARPIFGGGRFDHLQPPSTLGHHACIACQALASLHGDWVTRLFGSETSTGEAQLTPQDPQR